MKEKVSIIEGLGEASARHVATLYRRAPLLRQTDDLDRIATAYENSEVVLTAWLDDRLVGIARVLSDEVQVSVLCDLAVDPDVQGMGIGKLLVDGILERCPGTDLLLRDSNLSSQFFERLGFERVDNAWVRPA